MEFLKAILGEELYKQVESKINEFNGTPDNKDKQVKLANLGEGGYVGKDKYASLETTHNSKLEELKQANALIEELKKSSKDNEDSQAKILNYENQVKQLQEDLDKVKVESAIKVALLEAKAQDVDYLTFKLNQEGTEFKLDENGKIKGLDEKITTLKTQDPNQFASTTKQNVIENKLPNPEQKPGEVTKEAFNKMNYAERLKFYQDNREQYDEFTKK